MAHANNTVVVGLSGPSSGGKTTISRYLRSILPNAVILHQDDFYIAEADLPLDPRTGLANWDCAEAIDFESMVKVLEHLKAHRGQFPNGFDSKEDLNLVGAKEHGAPIAPQTLVSLKTKVQEAVIERQRLNPSSEDPVYLIVDGFLLYVDERLRNAIDVRLYTAAPYAVLKERRESRKGYVTMEGYWEDPPGYFDDVVWPNYLDCNGPFISLTDAVMNGEISGEYDDPHPKNAALREDQMTHGIDIINTGNVSIETMVTHSVELLAKRLKQLQSRK
ncbi:ribosylnicotinamide kinase [Actinomortierella ambigua]|nr:ribosylnicotinamide kinase [Actinomortierella ambigua]